MHTDVASQTGFSSLSVTPSIVVVDDDAVMQNMLLEFLGQNGMRASAASGKADLAEHLRSEPSLVILDLHLGQENGLDLLRLIRAQSDVPVVIITGHRRDEIDRILGLELGADDYLLKPFGLRELLARIRSILRRRTVGGGESPRIRVRRRVRFGPWELDRSSRDLHREGQRPISLTKGEFALLHAFLEAPQRPLSREHLLRATRIHEDVFDRSIDVQILRLRRKLETNPSAPEIIETVWGVGYVFRAEVESV